MTKFALLAFSALTLVACGQPTTTQTTETQTTTEAPPMAPVATAMTNADFAQAVANADAFEIQSSQLAASHAARAEVKTFATMMMRDHTATTRELTTLAPTIGLTAPTPMVDAAHQATLGTLGAQNGEAFDDGYLDAQVQAHQDAIRTFEEYVAGAQPGPLLDWANTTLPKLRDHLTRVQTLENAT